MLFQRIAGQQGFYKAGSVNEEACTVFRIGFGDFVNCLGKHVVVGQEAEAFPAFMAFKPGEIIFYLVQGFHRQVAIGS